METLKETKNLRGKNIFIEEDYFKEMQVIRKQLIKHRNKIRTQGHHVLMRYNKLIINGEDFYLEQLEAIGTEQKLERKTPKDEKKNIQCNFKKPEKKLTKMQVKTPAMEQGMNKNTNKNNTRNNEGIEIPNGWIGIAMWNIGTLSEKEIELTEEMDKNNIQIYKEERKKKYTLNK
ncbi:hypothetical protein FQA39_LY04570 [Lamprigera yunnana]|nr:hypothetical protein FQA39_LY04570 [Lamprigera yunnana]